MKVLFAVLVLGSMTGCWSRESEYSDLKCVDGYVFYKHPKADYTFWTRDLYHHMFSGNPVPVRCIEGEDDAHPRAN